MATDMIARAMAVSKEASVPQTLIDQINGNTQQVAVANARIDTIIALPEGSTTGDALLDDIKIGWDGRTYDTPGNAVRGQVGAIEDGLVTLYETVFDEVAFISGGYISANGIRAVRANSYYTDYFPVNPNDVIYLKGIAGVNAALIAFYSDNLGTFIQSFVPGVYGITSTKIIVPEGAKYARASSFEECGQYVRLSKVVYNDEFAETVSNILETIDNIEGTLNNITPVKYGHSLRKPFDFVGKTINFYGDSITYGTVSDKTTGDISPASGNSHSWANKFASMVGVTSSNYRNRAVAGTFICDIDNPNSIVGKILAETTARDYMIIAGGTNDWAYGKTLGEFADVEPTTFYGALRTICEKCKNDFPNSAIIFVTPINQNVSRPAAVEPLNKYREAIFEVATSYGFNVVDGSQIGFPKDHDAFALEMCADGVHPTEIGHDFYAKSMCGILL